MSKKNLHFAIVGAETLLGRELQEQIKERGLDVRVTLAGTESGISAVLGSEQDEAAAFILGSLEAEIEGVDVVFLTGSAEANRQAYDIWKESERKPLVIDLTGTLEERPEARLAVPGVRFQAGQLCVIPHPVAWMLFTMFGRLPSALRQAVVLVLEPASTLGQDALNELQQQTTGLLTFKSLDKRVYDAQLGFTILPRFGSEAPSKLEDAEQRIDRHMATLFGRPPLPSLRLVQAPVFHGYSMSLWLEFENNPGPQALAESLASADIEIREKDLEPPTNTGATGQPGIIVGAIEEDRNNPRALWAWAVADNFRISVDVALDVATSVEIPA